MELDHKENNNNSIQTIYNNLSSFFDALYNKYKYANITKEQIKSIAEEIINNTKDNTDCLANVKKEIQKQMNIALSNLVRDKLNNSDEAYDIINNYINLKFKLTDDVDCIIQYFNNLRLFFDTYDYNLLPDIITNLLIKNKIFKNMTEIYYSKFEETIIDGKLQDYIENPLLIFVINVYCENNNIEITENTTIVDEEDYDYMSKTDAKDVKKELRKISNIPYLTKEEQLECVMKAKLGDLDAKEKLILSHQRLIASIARNYIGKGLEFEDLMAYGNLGIYKTIEKFDPEYGCKFTTYAAWWIRQAIIRSITEYGRAISLPDYLYNRIYKMNETNRKLTLKLGREPTIEELANEMKVTPKRINELMRSQQDVKSIYEPVNGDEDADELLNFIPDNNTIEQVDRKILMINDLKKLFKEVKLTKREREVLFKSFGAFGYTEKTLEYIGGDYKVSRQRADQIKQKAFKKLRKSPKLLKLLEYTENPQRAEKRIEEYKKYYAEHPNSLYVKGITKYDREGRKNTINKKQEEMKEMAKKLTIYELLDTTSKSKVENAVNTLSEDEKKIVYKRYGEDFEFKEPASLEQDEMVTFYRYIYPKLKELFKKTNKPEGQAKRGRKPKNYSENATPTKTVVVPPTKDNSGPVVFDEVPVPEINYVEEPENNIQPVEEVSTAITEEQESIIEEPVVESLPVINEVEQVVEEMSKPIFEVQQPVIEEPVIDIPQPIIETEEPVVEEQLISTVKKNPNRTISLFDDDSNNEFEYLQTPPLSVTIDGLKNKNQRYVASLLFGQFIGGRCYTPGEIADMYPVDIEEVIKLRDYVLDTHENNIKEYFNYIRECNKQIDLMDSENMNLGKAHTKKQS